MKKILYTASTFGHLASFHRPYLKWFAARGCEVHAAAGGEPRGFDGVSRCVPVSFQKSMLSPRNVAAVFQLARLLRRERYDLISTHTALAAFFTRLAVRLAGKRGTVVMNTSHGYLFDGDTQPLKRALLLGAERLTAGVTDFVLTMNRQDAALARKYRLGREIIETPGMGVDTARLSPASSAQRRAARVRFGLPEDAFILVYVAEFSARKNQKLLLCALEALPPDVCLLLPGQGATLAACRAQAQARGLSARVCFPGFLTDIASAYHAADVCVSASRIEGLPFNVMEAMACGLPIVATAVKGHEDLVDGNGLLYKYGDAAAFCAAIARLRQEPDTRREMGEASKRLVRPLTLDAVQPVLAAIYESALS